MRVYRHYRPRNVWFPLVFLGILAMVAVGGLVWSGTKGFDTVPPFPVFLIALGVVGVNLWILGGSALEVWLADDGHVEFVAPLRTVRIVALDILSIAPSDFAQGSAFVLKHRNGSLRFDPRLTGMHELITELKRQNPSVELSGI